jgi:hypothetical protein
LATGFCRPGDVGAPSLSPAKLFPLPSARTNGKGMASEHLDFQHVAFLELIDQLGIKLELRHLACRLEPVLKLGRLR